MSLVKTAVTPTASSITAEDRPEIGSWWWIKGDDGDRKLDRDGMWLGCVVDVGSNYAKLKGVVYHIRLALDAMPERCVAEPDPESFVAQKLRYHKGQVRELMSEIRGVCARLGVPMTQALAANETSTALAVAHGLDDVKQYGTALVAAKDQTLPELFKRVKAQHAAMARWMNAELIPAQAELKAAEGVTEAIGNKIHMVELYAGLQEQLVQVREGAPAAVDAKIHLMQRRAYMDEECLAQYEAGGMDFESIKEFDAWLARDANLARLLPHARCIVAFRVRRDDKQYGDEYSTLADHIRFWHQNDDNEQTFLYIRNGHQLWRMATSIEFDEQLFPRQEDSDLLGQHELWIIGREHNVEVITGRQRNEKLETHKQQRAAQASLLWQWKRAGKPEDTWEYIAGDHDRYGRTPGTKHAITGRPDRGHWHDIYRDPVADYERLTPENIYYDDVMERVAKAAMDQNRIAVVVQGLLDRSTCLHPHPPWRIWTPDGFAAGVTLVYDVSRAITSGDAPDWQGYRAQLNKGIRVGAHTIGQRAAWMDAMMNDYGSKWRDRNVGNGPARIDTIRSLHRDGTATFTFTRERRTPKWVPNPKRPGYLKATYPDITMSWRCPLKHLTCIDTYTPGDFHMFYDDPRTRADYLKWAPILLAAEDWHHEHRRATASSSAAPPAAEEDLRPTLTNATAPFGSHARARSK